MNTKYTLGQEALTNLAALLENLDITHPDSFIIQDWIDKIAAELAVVPSMTTELARGRAALCALRYWMPEGLLPAVNRVIVNMAHAIGKATGDCPPEADGRTKQAARAALEEAAR